MLCDIGNFSAMMPEHCSLGDEISKNKPRFSYPYGAISIGFQITHKKNKEAFNFKGLS
jgi:hypothetical protein